MIASAENPKQTARRKGDYTRREAKTRVGFARSLQNQNETSFHMA
jgi:hypothetical protein